MSINKNSDKIISAIEQNYDKFNLIKDLRFEYYKKNMEKKILLEELRKKSAYILKNLCGRRKCLGIINGWVYFVSPIGITKTKNLNSKTFIKLGEKENEIRINEELYLIATFCNIKSPYVKLLNKETKNKLKRFFKNKRLLPDELRNAILLDNLQIKVSGSPSPTGNSINKTIRKITTEESNRNFDRNDFELLFFSENNRLENTVNLDYLGVSEKDKIYIEQTFTYVRDLIKKEIRSRTHEIIRLQKFMSKLKEEFPEYFMLEIIERDAR